MNVAVRRGVMTMAQHRPLITFPIRTPFVPVLPPPITDAQLNVGHNEESVKVVLNELPMRYRRRPIEEHEINLINLGGPE